MNTYKADSKAVMKIRQKAEFQKEKQLHEKQFLMDHTDHDVRAVRSLIQDIVKLILHTIQS